MSQAKRQPIMNMTDNEARSFFLKPSTYVPISLPSYFNFSKVLLSAEKMLSTKRLEDLSKTKTSLSKTSNVNYTLILNKDAKYDWRPVQIIHPVPYVDLVNYVCNHWNELLYRLKEFQQNPHLKCISLPVQSTSKLSDKEETILNWWENLEQASIKYSLDYKYCIKTDITNCYGSIYTHTIAWAIHGKTISKNNRTNQLIGNVIDKKIEYMQSGQTNGIPQGGSLFDFIAELVLGYSDLQMNSWLDTLGTTDYQIIRYRDDYRIFTNSKELAEQIVRQLSDVLADLNMHFNTKKTSITDDIIGTAIKPAKAFWTQQQPLLYTKSGTDLPMQYHMSLQKHLLQIYKLSEKFQNSGTVSIALSEYLTRIQKVPGIHLKNNSQPLISILVNIIIKSPNAIPLGVSILSHLFNQFDDTNEIIKTIDLIIQKVKDIPNIGFTEIWLQRLSLLVQQDKPYNNSLCKKIYDNQNIWNSEWLKDSFDESSIIDFKKIDQLNLMIPQNEVDIFTPYAFQ